MILHVEKLIERALNGEKLSSRERRHCLAHQMVHSPDETNVSLAKLYGVSEALIRRDKQTIRQEKAAMIKKDDVGLVIADIAFTFESQISDLEKAKKKAVVGSRTYLDYCKAIFDLQIKKVETLQNLGFYPKNLGNLTVQQYAFKAYVGKDQSVDTRPVELTAAEFEKATIEATPLLDQIVEASDGGITKAA